MIQVLRQPQNTRKEKLALKMYLYSLEGHRVVFSVQNKTNMWFRHGQPLQ